MRPGLDRAADGRKRSISGAVAAQRAQNVQSSRQTDKPGEPPSCLAGIGITERTTRDWRELTELVGKTSERADGLMADSTSDRAWIRAGKAWVLPNRLNVAGPPLLFGLRLWASVCLAIYVAFWLQLDLPSWAGGSAAIVCQPRLGASLRKGWFRMIGTLIGAVLIVLLTACFPQDRAGFLLGLALWCAACAFVATILKNFAAYAAALAGYTAAIVASNTLGATGGPDSQVFMLAINRATEICVGIVCAGIVLAGTDFGGARRRLAALLAALAADIARQFTAMLAGPKSGLPESQAVRRELIRRVVALDPVIDETIGESATLRFHSPVLQSAVDGLFAALAGWRTIAAYLVRLSDAQARQEAEAILLSTPIEFRAAVEQEGLAQWMEEPVRRRRICEAAARSLIALPASTPSRRLLLDQTAKLLDGMSQLFDGLALLVDDPARPRPRRRGARLRIPDWLPAGVNAGRAFVSIGAVELFWVLSAWPSGATAITFAAIAVLLLAPRAEHAYAAAMGFMLGTGLAIIGAAIIKFAILPGYETFAAFSIALGLYLVPAGTLLALGRQPAVFAAMLATFVPLLAPANQISYDTAQFYNTAMAILVGCSAAAISFRLLPPLSPAFRTRRLLALTLRDLRCLARDPIRQTVEDWEDHVRARLVVMPDEAEPLQRAQLLATLPVGREIIQLRRVGAQLGLGPDLDAALEALVSGNSGTAIARLAYLDHFLAKCPEAALGTQVALRARSSILVMSEALAHHASYFDAGAPR